VKYAVDPSKRRPDTLTIANVRLDKFRSGINPVQFTRSEIIEDTDVVTEIEQSISQMRPDETAASGHEHHFSSTLKLRH
jgi:hypothetical protein